MDLACRRQCLSAPLLSHPNRCCFRLHLNLATTACLYLIIIVLLSLLGSFLSAAVVSLIALGVWRITLRRRFSLSVSDPLNVAAIAAFWIASAVISGCVQSAQVGGGEPSPKIEDERERKTHLRGVRLISLTPNNYQSRELGYERDDLRILSRKCFAYSVWILNEHRRATCFSLL